MHLCMYVCMYVCSKYSEVYVCIFVCSACVCAIELEGDVGVTSSWVRSVVTYTVHISPRLGYGPF